MPSKQSVIDFLKSHKKELVIGAFIFAGGICVGKAISTVGTSKSSVSALRDCSDMLKIAKDFSKVTGTEIGKGDYILFLEKALDRL